MSQISKMVKAIDIFQRKMGKRSKASNDLTAVWIEMLLMVAEAGEAGTTSKELGDTIGVAQGIISRTTKYLSIYKNKVTGDWEGYDLIKKEKDMENLHRDRIFLTTKGKKFIREIEDALT